MDFQGALSALSAIPLDWIVIAAFFIIVSADALRSGSAHASALALSLPITSFLFKLVPQTILIGSLTASFKSEIEQVIIFAIIEAILFVCFNQMFLTYDGYTSLFSAAISGLAATIVLVAVWVQVPILESLWRFDPSILGIFGTSYVFLWFLLAYFALAYVGS